MTAQKNYKSNFVCLHILFCWQVSVCPWVRRNSCGGANRISCSPKTAPRLHNRALWSTPQQKADRGHWRQGETLHWTGTGCMMSWSGDKRNSRLSWEKECWQLYTSECKFNPCWILMTRWLSSKIIRALKLLQLTIKIISSWVTCTIHGWFITYGVRIFQKT